MFQVQEKQRITRLKTLLNCNYTYIFLFIGLFLYLFIRCYFDNNSSYYDLNDNSFQLIVDDYYIDGNKLTLRVKGKEMLVANYYIDTYDELMYLKDNIKYGVSISVNGELYLPSNNTIPNTFNYKDYLKNNGITYILNISKLEILDEKINFIYKIKNYLSKRIKAIDDTGYMEAFILGDKNYINSDIYLLYQKIGVTHLFAISGMHVGLLCSVIFKLLRKINDKSKYLFTSFILILYG